MTQLVTDPGGAPAGRVHRLAWPVPPVAVVFGAILIDPLRTAVGSITTCTKSPTFCSDTLLLEVILLSVYNPVTNEGLMTTSVFVGTWTCRPATGVRETAPTTGGLSVPSVPLMVHAVLSTDAVKLPLLVASAADGARIARAATMGKPMCLVIGNASMRGHLTKRQKLPPEICHRHTTI